MPAATAASTKSLATGRTGERTETPSGPSELCAIGSMTITGRCDSLAFAKIRQHLGIAPAGGAAFGPLVEVAGMAAHVHHVVDAGGASEHFAARHRDAASIEAQSGLFARVGGVHPVDGGVELQGGTGDRDRGELRRAITGFDE